MKPRRDAWFVTRDPKEVSRITHHVSRSLESLATLTRNVDNILATNLSDLSTIISLILVFTLGSVAYFLKTVNKSGLISGLVVGALISISLGLPGFAILAAFFVLGSGTSKFGYEKKEALGVAQDDRGARGVRHAIANAGVAVILAVLILFGVFDADVLSLGYVGAFATAAADTVSSELGQLYGKHPVLLTSFKRVPVGTEGAVSIEGTLLGILASLILAAAAFAVGLVQPIGIAIVIVGAFVGTSVESFLGAICGGRNILGNDAMNFINTAIGAGACMMAALVL